MTLTLPPLTREQAHALVPDEGLLARGQRLVERGAVVHLLRRGRTLLGNVVGSEPVPYAVQVEAPPPGKRRWGWHCTCPFFQIYGGPCKHSVALLLQWVEAPERFTAEASLDEALAGPQRGPWLALLRDTLHADPALRRLLAIEPERKRPLGRPIALAPYEEQLRYALRRFPEGGDDQAQRFRGVLETAAGYLRIQDAANAARLATLLAAALLPAPEWQTPPRATQSARLLPDTLTLLEAAALDADWPPAERAAWLGRVMGWWEITTELHVADRLLDMVLHSYQREELPQVEGWLRGLLRRPVQANRLSSALWRQRVLSFLLALYESADRTDALLDLCWEEGADALAARTLVERGNALAARQLAEQGLGSSNAHREVAAALLEAQEAEQAQAVARAGLRYQDGGRGALLAWLAARALESHEDARALSLAQQAWEQGPTLERYLLLREAAQRAEAWPDLQRALHAALEHQGAHGLLVEVLCEEEAWRAAAALLPCTAPRREELTELVARGMAGPLPDEAIPLLFDLAEVHAEGKSRPAYARAAQALLGAQSLAEATGNEALFAALLQGFLAAQARRPALRDEVSKVLGERAGGVPWTS